MPDSDGCQSIGKVIFANQSGMHLVKFSFFSGSPLKSEVGGIAGNVAVDIQTVFFSVGYRIQSPGYFPEVRIVLMKEDGGVSLPAQIVVQFAFGPDNAFERTEAFQMSLSYIGDNPIIGFGYFHQFLDVAGVAGSHFHYAELMLCCQAQQGERYTDRIIQISQCVQYIVLLRQYGGYKLLGRCFPIGSCNADDARTQLAAVIIGKLLQGVQAVIH